VTKFCDKGNVGARRIKVKEAPPKEWLARLGVLKVSAKTPESMTPEGWPPDRAALDGELKPYGFYSP